MKKEQKQILYIFTFLILGCVIGYFVAVTQMKQVSDPEYIAFWASQDMPGSGTDRISSEHHFVWNAFFRDTCGTDIFLPYR